MFFSTMPEQQAETTLKHKVCGNICFETCFEPQMFSVCLWLTSSPNLPSTNPKNSGPPLPSLVSLVVNSRSKPPFFLSTVWEAVDNQVVSRFGEGRHGFQRYVERSMLRYVERYVERHVVEGFFHEQKAKNIT